MVPAVWENESQVVSMERLKPIGEMVEFVISSSFLLRAVYLFSHEQLCGNHNPRTRRMDSSKLPALDHFPPPSNEKYRS
jgi:hypothetical protein